MQPFSDWLKANGYDEAALSPKQRKDLEAAWKAETGQLVPLATVPASGMIPVANLAPASPAASVSTSYEAELEIARRESTRISEIDRLVKAQIHASVQFPERVERLNLLRNAAVEGKWDLHKVQFELLKESRNLGPIVSVVRDKEMTAEVIEAAALRGAGYPHLEKRFSEQTLSEVDRKWRRGIGLNELLVEAAEHNSNYRGSKRDLGALCRAAFRRADGGYSPMAGDIGPSTIDVTGILSNIANKFLESGFLFTEQTWRQIAKIRPANDYKTMTLYRLGGDNKLERVSKNGEIKHGTLSELSYTVQAKTHAKIIGIGEEDMRNDDLGAFAQVSDELGRGGGDAINVAFWTEFLDDSAFFTSGNANYDDGAVDSVLSLAGLNNAETIFRLQTKPDGTPFGVMPAIILTPATLANTALQLMGSQGLVVGTTPASGPQQNVFFGRYRVASSVYCDAVATIGTTAWWLLADPNNVAVMNICFLDGIDRPIAEAGEFDFDRLGMAMRAKFAFGVGKGEYRAGVKLKGAA